MPMRLVALSLFIVAASLTPSVAASAEIKGLFPLSLEHTAKDVLPNFQRSSGHRVTIEYGTAGGVAVKVRNGEVADVVITTAAQIDALQREGKVVAGGNAGISKVGVGALVRKGAPKPDISSVE